MGKQRADSAPDGVPAGDAFGILVISHGNLAVELVGAMRHLMGAQGAVAALSIPASEPLATTRRRLANLAERTATPAGLVLLTDLFGGTPANLAHELLARGRASHMLTGVNLPMLVRLAELRGCLPVEAAVEEAAAAARRFIRVEATPPRRRSAG